MKTIRPATLKKYPLVRPRRQRWVPRPLRKGWGIARKINRTARKFLELSDIEKLDSIEGHLHPKEGMVLFHFAYHALIEGRVVEIGTFKGKSAAWLATGLKLGNIDDRVVTIDPHVNVQDPEVVPYYGEPSSYEIMLDNLRGIGLLSFIEPVVATSHDAAKNWCQPIRLLFIDGSHRYQDVLLDLKLWVPRVNRRGVICMHDTRAQMRGVNYALKDYIKSQNNIRRVLQLSNLTVLEKVTMD